MTDRRAPRLTPQLDRRCVLAGGAAFVSLVAPHADATPEEAARAMSEVFADRPVTQGRVSLSIPPIAENGNSVSLSIDVESPMTPEDYVRQIAVFSDTNPLPDIVRFHLGPRAGLAHVKTRVRLSRSQTVLAIAEMSDGRLWSGSAATFITLAACVSF